MGEVRIRVPGSNVVMDYASEAERQAALLLAQARQAIAGPMCLAWAELSGRDQEIAAVEARNWLRAAVAAKLLPASVLADSWSCEAYGPGPAEAAGAVCFVSGRLGVRVCGDSGECGRVMVRARQRLFSRISERAAGGDDTAGYLAGVFTSPDRLRGGGEDVGQAGPGDETGTEFDPGIAESEYGEG
jgi:hypothetical protein